MTPADNPEAYLNAFEWMAMTVGWERSKWAAVLIPCLLGPAYTKVRAAILQMLNLSPEVYRRQLQEIDFGPDYQPHAIGQDI